LASIFDENSYINAIAFVEQASAPTTVATRWLLYPKSGGFYQKSPAGTELRLLTATDLSGLSGTYQPLDSDLTAIAALATTGLIARTGSGTAAIRTITGTANRLTATNGDGVSGNPTLTIPDSAQLNIAKIVNLTTNGFMRTGSGDGTQSVVSTGELYVPAGSMASQTTTGAESVKNEAATNKQTYYTLDFDQSTIEYAQFQVVMPATYAGGTITFAVYWTAASGSGDAIFTLEALARANDDAIDASWGTGVSVTDTLTATGDLDISPTSSAVTIGGSPAASIPVFFRVSRKASDGSDTLTADAKLIGLKIFYTM
jgi:hypothetical protein